MAAPITNPTVPRLTSRCRRRRINLAMVGAARRGARGARGPAARLLAALAAVAVCGASSDYATPESHPQLEDMVSRVFAIDETTAANERAIDDYFSSRSGPKAGVVFLLKDLRFNGQPYKQNAKWGACTYMDQAIRSVGSLLSKGSLLAKFPKCARAAPPPAPFFSMNPSPQ